jgi:hypothetical protein
MYVCRGEGAHGAHYRLLSQKRGAPLRKGDWGNRVASANRRRNVKEARSASP